MADACNRHYKVLHKFNAAKSFHSYHPYGIGYHKQKEKEASELAVLHDHIRDLEQLLRDKNIRNPHFLFGHHRVASADPIEDPAPTTPPPPIVDDDQHPLTQPGIELHVAARELSNADLGKSDESDDHSMHVQWSVTTSEESTKSDEENSCDLD
jgi:hypothetical protein